MTTNSWNVTFGRFVPLKGQWSKPGPPDVRFQSSFQVKIITIFFEGTRFGCGLFEATLPSNREPDRGKGSMLVHDGGGSLCWGLV